MHIKIFLNDLTEPTMNEDSIDVKAAGTRVPLAGTSNQGREKKRQSGTSAKFLYDSAVEKIKY